MSLEHGGCSGPTEPLINCNAGCVIGVRFSKDLQDAEFSENSSENNKNASHWAS